WVDPRLMQGSGNGPSGCAEDLGEAVGHLLEELFVLTANDSQALLGLGLLVHLGDPGFESALKLVDARPAVLGRIRLDPLGRVAVALGQRGTDLLDLATELGHQTTGFPLRLPTYVAVDPEAAAATSDDAERPLVLASTDELAGVGQERPLLEAERVDVAEVTGV